MTRIAIAVLGILPALCAVAVTAWAEERPDGDTARAEVSGPSPPEPEAAAVDREPCVTEDPTRPCGALTVAVLGNAVLTDEIYLALAADWAAASKAARGRPSSAAAASLARQVHAFLVRSGYELAAVRGEVNGETITLHVNEGRVARVLVRGPSTVEALLLQFHLSIPGDVYNRLALDRQMRVLQRDYGLEGIRYELTPVPFDHLGRQVQAGSAVHGRDDAPAPPLGYELHILVERDEWRPGWTLDATYDISDGVALRGSYSGDALAFGSDRWLAVGGVGAASFPGLGGEEDQVQMSLLYLEGRWHAPPLLLDDLRLHVALVGDWRVRQRRDLDVQTFNWLRTSVLGKAEYRVKGRARIEVGAGLESRHAFGFERWTDDDGTATGSATPRAEPVHQLRPVGSLRLALNLDKSVLRLDRRHEITLETRHYFGRSHWHVEGRYQKVFELGWNDLWLRLGGVTVTGTQTCFFDDQPIYSYVRGLFNHIYWARSLGALSVEYRYSIYRDTFKVGAFNDVTVFDDAAHGEPGSAIKVAEVLGVGLHTLMLNLVQLDIYCALGASSDGFLDLGFTASLSKAF